MTKQLPSKTDAKGASTSGNRMKPVRFNATYDASASEIGCFFIIVERVAAAN
jgi:hypothetical protein